MTCNLVKEVVTIDGDKGQKAKKYVNYFLIFQNGYKLPINVRLYDTDKVTGDKEELLKKVNFSNSQIISAFADDITNGK